ncbi:MAG: DUF2752 domain-containing protein [Acidimicrobiales bacterium]|nr:DUF2752 domain-containing protein [Acidimicrobiales bacterium]
MNQRGAHPLPRAVHARWAGFDAHPTWFWLIAAGGVGAVALAAVGLPPISFHGPLHFFGIMGPTCGMTRSVRYLALGDVATALRYNPSVLLLPLLAVAVLARTAVGRLTGHWLEISIQWRRIVVAFPLVVALVLLTIRQQANVELLGP